MIVGPLATGLGLLCLRPDYWRRVLVVAGALLVVVGSLLLAHWPANGGMAAALGPGHWINAVMLASEFILALALARVGWRAGRPLVVGLALAQAALMGWFEWRFGKELSVVQNLFVDKFSVIMGLINGVVGGGICLYALAYMREYHEAHHREAADRRPLFFALLFIFMGAMFGVIFANNLIWLYFFWEVTTVCSFLLIGYRGDALSRRNALQALTMNLAGGLCFALGIVWLHHTTRSVELQTLLRSHESALLIPAALFCLAGLTKSAQLPFCGWLLGAMVAPTPVSALLHSSAMVKAGVYLVLRLAPVLNGSAVGLGVALVGAVTFLYGSLAAIRVNDAKKVLAYSTVANLGLIVLCGGLGTAEALWAGLLLIVFHAVAKCLLFLCVGVVEHRLHTRDIEAMSGLILNMPRVAVLMLVGMAGMFLAPFGMLISKWAVLKAVVDVYPMLTVFLVFGSAATLFFWVKWMGKLLEVVHPPEPAEKGIRSGQWLALYSLAGLTFLTCLFFPFISLRFIEPYVVDLYGRTATMGIGNYIIMTIMMLLVTLFPLSFLNYGRNVKVMDPYLGGANLAGHAAYRGWTGRTREVALCNYQMVLLVDEDRLTHWSTVVGVALLVTIALVACL